MKAQKKGRVMLGSVKAALQVLQGDERESGKQTEAASPRYIPM